ncbi:MAG TPA: 16S rRNA (cytidine(1402)-2'-O)-methyltransferase [Dongiaceae bacterium]|nr:16S rRNA (cytidine(1402)-2'-O)-methyltransferase [Dongiaceae bacterium]
MASGTLYIVATPIGNLNDITLRALEVLKQVDLIAAEDTRHSKKLLDAYAIGTRLISLHDHNEADRAGYLLQLLQQGQSVALISDAGTPLISDPGYRLVKAVREAGEVVVTIPGACAAIAALSIAGLPTDRFLFAGFLPAKQQARRTALEELLRETATLVFYESPKRIVELVQDVGLVLGEQRQLALAKELTKTFETVTTGTALELVEWLQADEHRQRGEFVVLVEGYIVDEGEVVIDPKILRALTLAKEQMPLKKACALVSELTGVPKNQLYDVALKQFNA